jgi:hypothetical protein
VSRWRRSARVSAYDALGSVVFIPVGMSIARPVADAVGLTETLWLAFAIALGCVIATLAVPDVRNLGRREEPQPEPPAIAAR